MNVTYDFSDKVVVITGGVSGIGLATTNGFAAAGATVIVWDYSDEKVATEGVETRRVDLRDSRDVEAAASETLARHGRVDVLINNAGVNFGDQSVSGVSDKTWEAHISTNLKGTLNAVRALSPSMIEQGRGTIINTGSIQARNPVAGFSAYSASKAGVVALTKVWSRELGPHGITVNAVSPGLVDTTMNSKMEFGMKHEVLRRTGLRRVSQVEEISAVHLFLASDGASFINGIELPVDGGLNL